MPLLPVQLLVLFVFIVSIVDVVGVIVVSVVFDVVTVIEFREQFFAECIQLKFVEVVLQQIIFQQQFAKQQFNKQQSKLREQQSQEQQPVEFIEERDSDSLLCDRRSRKPDRLNYSQQLLKYCSRRLHNRLVRDERTVVLHSAGYHDLLRLRPWGTVGNCCSLHRELHMHWI